MILNSILEPVLSGFVETELRGFDLSSLALDEDRARAAIREDLLQQHTGLNTASAKQKRHQRFSIPGSTPEDFAEHVIALGAGQHVLCGIRHMNLNPERPFINLLADFPLDDVESVGAVYRSIEERFRVFSPRSVAVGTRQPIGGQLRAVHMVQQAASIQAQPPWPAEASLTLQQVADPSYFEWYCAGYQSFHDRNPHLVDVVSVNGRAVMEQSREEGLLYYMMCSGERVGLIAAVSADFLGHPGLYFNEIFIAATHTGRGLAKALQRKFIAQCAPREALVWGTIDAQNLPSYRTAQANGRIPIRYESFVPIHKGGE